MPKGRRGCYFCGAPTARHVQIWIRGPADETIRKARDFNATIDSVSRSLCLPCADNEVLDMRDELARQHPKVHGCGICGEKCSVRVQVWVRTADNTRGTKQAFSTAYCATDGREIYDRIAERLGNDRPRTKGGNARPGNLAKARKRRWDNE